MFLTEAGFHAGLSRGITMKEARYYRSQPDGDVLCELCPHGCRIKVGHRGLCGVRENREGRLFSLVYGNLVAANVDPIEKKPLFHFQPGSRSFSIATVGCNLKCRHCQNADISQMPSDHGRIAGREMRPELLVSEAISHGCASISYTYTEPTVFFEYAYDTAKLADQAGLRNVFVTNGYVESEPLRAIAPWLHAANVDLKSYSDAFYRQVCKARLDPVLRTLQLMKELNIWIEVTTLLIPGLNDGDDELRGLAGFLRGLDPGIPWHLSAFHPTYRMTDRDRTPVETLHRAWKIGKEEGLHFVYTGNVPGDERENTVCPDCGALLIGRKGYRIVEMNLKEDRCGQCGIAIPMRL